MNRDNFPSGVTGSEPEITGWSGVAEWEAWAAAVKPGDQCEAAGALATVTAVTPEFLWARVDRQADALPWEWEDVGPVRP